MNQWKGRGLAEINMTLAVIVFVAYMFIWGPWQIDVASTETTATLTVFVTSSPIDNPLISVLAILFCITSLPYLVLSNIPQRRTIRPRRSDYTEFFNCVYLMRRKRDGVYKIGKTNCIEARRNELQDVYGPLDLMMVWEIKDNDRAEKIALSMTKQYQYSENGHRELRKMTDREARLFRWRFSEKLRGVVNGQANLTPN